MFSLKLAVIPAVLARSGVLLAVVLLLILASRGAWAVAPEFDPSVLLGERPSAGGEPLVVEVGAFIIDIDEIDDVNQRFNIDMFIVVRWQDPRLALPEEERKGQTRFMSLDGIWTPRALILNNRGLNYHLREGVEVDDLGNAKVKNRMTGELAANLEFQEFPFDTQRLPVDIVSYQYSTDEMQFSLSSSLISHSDQFSVEGWHLKELEPELGVFVVPSDGSELPRLTYVIEAKRDSDYYVLTMLVPMSLIIFM
ncbi:MAG: hypothetical protein OET41_13540, partial [Xanthomonadales bacterium]|nr:hypothetical protein [Xanthomonadales bacterium]